MGGLLGPGEAKECTLIDATSNLCPCENNAAVDTTKTRASVHCFMGSSNLLRIDPFLHDQPIYRQLPNVKLTDSRAFDRQCSYGQRPDCERACRGARDGEPYQCRSRESLGFPRVSKDFHTAILSA